MSTFNGKLFEDFNNLNLDYTDSGTNYIVFNDDVDVVRHEGDSAPLVIKGVGVYILVEPNDLIFRTQDESPTTTTEARKGAKAFNVYDLKSWTLNSVSSTAPVVYEWVEDDEFSPRPNGAIQVAVEDNYYDGKTYRFSLFSPRYELAYMNEYPACSSPLVAPVNEALRGLLVEGLYPYRVDLIDGENQTRILDHAMIIER